MQLRVEVLMDKKTACIKVCDSCFGVRSRCRIGYVMKYCAYNKCTMFSTVNVMQHNCNVRFTLMHSSIATSWYGGSSAIDHPFSSSIVRFRDHRTFVNNIL